MTKHRTLRRPLAVILATLGLVAWSGAAAAAEERWTCCAPGFQLCSPDIRETVITLTGDPAKKTGTVTFDTVTTKTRYGVELDGHTRIWMWSTPSEGKTSMLELSPPVHRVQGGNGGTPVLDWPLPIRAVIYVATSPDTEFEIQSSFRCRHQGPGRRAPAAPADRNHR